MQEKLENGKYSSHVNSGCHPAGLSFIFSWISYGLESLNTGLFFQKKINKNEHQNKHIRKTVHKISIFIFKSLLTTSSNALPFTPKAKFPAHNLNFHWRWWDGIQPIFLNLFYFGRRSRFSFYFISKNAWILSNGKFFFEFWF